MNWYEEVEKVENEQVIQEKNDTINKPTYSEITKSVKQSVKT